MGAVAKGLVFTVPAGTPEVTSSSFNLKGVRGVGGSNGLAHKRVSHRIIEC